MLPSVQANASTERIAIQAIRYHLPKYRHYKPKDLAVVRLDGKDHYLGKYRVAKRAGRKYRRLVAEWMASPRTAGAGRAAAG